MLALFMTVSGLSEFVRSLLTYSLRVDHTVKSCAENSQSDYELDDSKLRTRENLESLYAKLVRMPDCDERKARRLSMLGRKDHALYQEENDRADLNLPARRCVAVHLDPCRIQQFS
jgi:hypothetical protein